jgi:hypothetical protein
MQSLQLNLMLSQHTLSLKVSHVLGSYLLCVPSQVSQSHLSIETQSNFLIRAIGALRIMRHKQRVAPDEASYRAMIIACGRVSTDRRAEIVKLFGLMRQQGVFPNAVTLGQYTRAIAEGFNRRKDAQSGGVLDSSEPKERGTLRMLNSLDSSLSLLDEVGRNFAQRSRNAMNTASIGADDENHSQNGQGVHIREKKKNVRSWKPVMCSSSFSSMPRCADDDAGLDNNILRERDVKLVALWSRTKACDQCGYTPMDEEIQAGWFSDPDVDDGLVACPRCSAKLFPLLGYRFLTMDDALGEPESAEVELDESFEAHAELNASTDDEVQANGISAAQSRSFAESSFCADLRGYDFRDVPPQLRPLSSDPSSTQCGEHPSSAPPASITQKKGFVPYLNPVQLRRNLERLIEEFGERALVRDNLRSLDATTFFNLWWFCARFSLPLPLPLEDGQEDRKDGVFVQKARSQEHVHYCAFASWDRSIALQGCKSGAQVIRALIKSKKSEHGKGYIVPGEPLGSFPTMSPYDGLLDAFSLQVYTKSDWEHRELSQILVELVAATNEDSRDIAPVLEATVNCNLKRQSWHAYGDTLQPTTGELDCYRTLLYLVRYQCTSAFHVFFPSVAKPCKGYKYHFWCSKGSPLPIFDRIYQDAWQRVNEKHNKSLPSNTRGVSDTALAFRSTFGHIL